jgi:hypothetical protein
MIRKTLRTDRLAFPHIRWSSLKRVRPVSLKSGNCTKSQRAGIVKEACILASLQAAKHPKSVGVNAHGGIAMTMAVVFRPLVLRTPVASSHA